jgi:hypothetical protein
VYAPMAAALEQHGVADVAKPRALQHDQVTARIEARFGERSSPEITLLRGHEHAVLLDVAIHEHRSARRRRLHGERRVGLQHCGVSAHVELRDEGFVVDARRVLSRLAGPRRAGPVEIGEPAPRLLQLGIVGQGLRVQVDRRGHGARLLSLHRGRLVLELPAGSFALDGLVAFHVAAARRRASTTRRCALASGALEAASARAGWRARRRPAPLGVVRVRSFAPSRYASASAADAVGGVGASVRDPWRAATGRGPRARAGSSARCSRGGRGARDCVARSTSSTVRASNGCSPVSIS